MRMHVLLMLLSSSPKQDASQFESSMAGKLGLGEWYQCSAEAPLAEEISFHSFVCF